jgi:predicted dehydrogenase
VLVVKLAVLGCGDVAFRTYFGGLQSSTDQIEIVALCDPVQERAERAAALFPGSDALTSLEALIARTDVEGVINLTPAPLHRDTTGALLEAGFHVLSEKPLATTVSEGQTLIDLANAKGKLLLCAPANMASPRTREMQRLLSEGVIGRATHAFARLGTMGPAGWADYTGDPAVFYTEAVGPSIDLGVYLITTLTGLFGPARRVQAMGGILIPERVTTIPRLSGQTITVSTPDLISMNLEFSDNRFATIISSFATPANRGPVLEVFGERGVLAVQTDLDYWVNQNVDLFQFEASSEGEAGWTTIDHLPEESTLVSGPRHFAACIRGEETPVMTSEHALHVLDVMNTAKQAITSGNAQTISTSF